MKKKYVRKCRVSPEQREKVVECMLLNMSPYEAAKKQEICADEGKRLESLHKLQGRMSLLNKYGYTEEMAKQKCIEYGLLSPCYKYSKRGGCWSVQMQNYQSTERSNGYILRYGKSLFH